MEHPLREDEATRWVRFLNHLLALDPEWVSKMCRVRHGCEEAIAEHPTVQVAAREHQPKLFVDRDLDGHAYAAGFVGALNGFLGAYPENGHGPVAFDFDGETGRVLKFYRTPRPGFDDVDQG